MNRIYAESVAVFRLCKPWYLCPSDYGSRNVCSCSRQPTKVAPPMTRQNKRVVLSDNAVSDKMPSAIWHSFTLSLSTNVYMHYSTGEDNLMLTSTGHFYWLKERICEQLIHNGFTQWVSNALAQFLATKKSRKRLLFKSVGLEKPARASYGTVAERKCQKRDRRELPANASASDQEKVASSYILFCCLLKIQSEQKYDPLTKVFLQQTSKVTTAEVSISDTTQERESKRCQHQGS